MTTLTANNTCPWWCVDEGQGGTYYHEREASQPGARYAVLAYRQDGEGAGVYVEDHRDREGSELTPDEATALLSAAALAEADHARE